jgi:iron(III) transport system substrate-binding protein
MIAAHGEAATETWAQAIRLIFTNQSNRGNHMNISGGGVAKHAKNKAAAIAFLEFLTEEKAQHLYGEINFEYPVNPAVSVNGELASWGRFKPDNLPIERLAALAPKAQMIIDRVGW